MIEKPLEFEKNVWERMIQASEAGYPKEVCGLLFGKEGSPTVSRVEILSNILEERFFSRLKELAQAQGVSLPQSRMGRGGAFEFVIDPREHQRAVLKAAIEGFDQMGLFHSHPDHSPKPSATDASQPMLAGWANVIVSVTQGKVKDADKDICSWRRETEDSPFQSQEIVVK